MHTDFRSYCREYFYRLCRGYAAPLDDTLIRAWLPGHKTAADSGGAWDMSTRMFPALAAWLSDPSRPRRITVRGQEIDLESLTRAIFERAFDPDSPGYWGMEQFDRKNQRTVESSMLAYGAWLLRDTLLPTLPPRAIEQFRRWLEYFASAPLVQVTTSKPACAANRPTTSSTPTSSSTTRRNGCCGAVIRALARWVSPHPPPGRISPATS